MSRKISNVNLEAFRAYENVNNFDFTINKNEVANLIVLYAPNGTGKTSFFDAVEWAMSGEIQRISDNQRVKEIADQEKGHILKNKYSDKNNGTVEIIFSDNEQIKRVTRKTSKRTKTDYAVGKNVSLNSKIVIDKTKEFVSKNILTHDQVDSFLRFQNSKERYDAFRKFWDFKDDSGMYNELSFIIKEIENQKIRLKKTQDQITIDLKKFTLNKETLMDVDKIIQEYNNLTKNSEIKKINEDNLEEILNISILNKSRKEEELSIKNNNLKEIKNLYEVFNNDFQKKLVDFNIINNVKIPSNIKKLDDLNVLSDCKTKKEKFIQQINVLEKKINKIKFLSENENKFIEIKKEIESTKKNQGELVLNHKINSENLFDINQKLSLEKNTLEKIMIEKQTLDSKNTKLDSLINIKNLTENISNLNYEKVILNKSIDNMNKLIINNKVKIENLMNLISMDVKELFNSSDLINELTNEQKKIYSELYLYNKELIDIKIQLNSKEKEIESFKKTGDDITKLKKIGMNILNKSHSTDCPLCHQKYDDVHALIEKIENLDSGLHKINEYNIDITRLSKKKKNVEECIRLSLYDFQDVLKKEIQDTTETNNKVKIDKAHLEEKYHKKELEEKVQNNEFRKLNLLIEEFNFKNLDPDQMIHKIKELKILLAEKIFDFNKKINKNKEVIKKLEFTIDNLILTKNKITDDLKQNELTLTQLNNSFYYKEYKSIQTEMNLTGSLSLKNIGMELDSEKNKIKIQLKDINKKIIDVENKVGKEIKSEILNSNEKLKREVNKLEFFIDSNKKEFIRKFKKENVSEKDFIEKIKNLSDEIKLLKYLNDLLSKLINTLSGYANNTIKTDKELELKEIKAETRNLNKQLKNILSLKEISHDYIKNRIENVFNLDSVNNIFQMINPHPELKEIYFKLDESLRYEGLGLNIMCKSDVENSPGEAPILYLSSAQINILSLSIFLASAIESTNEFDSILMDDPVQHLDELNILSFIDLIRIICFVLDKQIIISTHDQGFFNLCQRKIDTNYFSAKYFDLSPNLENISSKS